MTKENEIMETLENEYTDCLIKLALQYEEEQEIECLKKQDDLPICLKEEPTAQKIYFLVQKKLEKRRKKEKYEKWVNVMRKAGRRSVGIAACVILVLGIIAPVAIANVKALRSQVMQLLIRIDNEQGTAKIRFEKDDESSFNVPEEWGGLYYPSFIPEGFELTAYDEWGTMMEVTYSKSDKVFFNFTELDEDTVLSAGIEDSEITYTNINGNLAFTTVYDTEGWHYVRYVWSTDDRWFVLDGYGMKEEELLYIAEKVKRIIF